MHLTPPNECTAPRAAQTRARATWTHEHMEGRGHGLGQTRAAGPISWAEEPRRSHGDIRSGGSRSAEPGSPRTVRTVAQLLVAPTPGASHAAKGPRSGKPTALAPRGGQQLPRLQGGQEGGEQHLEQTLWKSEDAAPREQRPGASVGSASLRSLRGPPFRPPAATTRVCRPAPPVPAPFSLPVGLSPFPRAPRSPHPPGGWHSVASPGLTLIPHQPTLLHDGRSSRGS